MTRATQALRRQAEVLTASALRLLVSRLVKQDHPAILDLTANRDTHVAATMQPARVVGLGLKESDCAVNSTLD